MPGACGAVTPPLARAPSPGCDPPARLRLGKCAPFGQRAHAASAASGRMESQAAAACLGCGLQRSNSYKELFKLKVENNSM